MLRVNEFQSANGLQIDDESISKVHATLLLTKQRRLVVADTGSTNGTFVNGTRLDSGKAAEIDQGAKVMFGMVSMTVESVNADRASADTEIHGFAIEGNLAHERESIQ